MIEKDYDEFINLLQQNIRFLDPTECIGQYKLDLFNTKDLLERELTNFAIATGAEELDGPIECDPLYNSLGAYWLKDNGGSHNCIGGIDGNLLYLPLDRHNLSARLVLPYTLISPYVQNITWNIDGFLIVKFGEYIQNDLHEKSPVTWVVDVVANIAITKDLIVPGKDYLSSLEYIKGPFIRELVSREYFKRKGSLTRIKKP